MAQLEGVYRAQRTRLRSIATASANRAFATYYHDRALALARIIPVVLAAQRQQVALVDAYMTAKTRAAFGVATVKGLDPAAYTIDVLRGVAAATVYERPWGALGGQLDSGADFASALGSAQAYLSSNVATDIQMAQTYSARDWMSGDERIVGYARVTAGGCDLCEAASDRTYYSDDLMPIHEHCVLGDTVVSGSGLTPTRRGSEAPDLRAIHATTRRWYDGEVIVIRVASSRELTVTPNHPVLTDRGWVAAGFLREGDSVISSRRFDGVVGRIPNEEDMPTRIEDRFSSSAVGALVSVPFAAEQFHGDRGDSEVDVVTTDSRLDADRLASLFKPMEHHSLGGRTRPPRRSRLCRAHQRILSSWAPALGGVGGGNSRLSFGGGLASGAENGLLAGAALLDAQDSEMPVDRTTADAVPFGQLQDGLASEVTLDSVSELRRFDWSGHVFNLVTRDGWYSANGILTHNCNCTTEPVFGSEQVASVGTTTDYEVDFDPEIGPRLMATSWSSVGPRITPRIAA